MRSPADFPEHTDENRRIWNANARWWDDRIGDGNDFQDILIEPATERLRHVSANDTILDVACGAGRFARRRASLERFAEISEEEPGRHVARTGVKVSSDLSVSARKTEGIIGQPEPQFFFHRPISRLFQQGFDAGFVVDGFEEPGFPTAETSKAGVSWRNMPDIPPILVVRLRLA